MEQPLRYLPAQEILDLGLLHEINRLLLHPLGFALQIEPRDDAFIGRVWDCREDPEGIYFGEDLLNADKAVNVCELVMARREERMKRRGFVIQPVDTERPTLTTTRIDPAERTRG